MANNEYKTQFEAYVTVLESYEGLFAIHPYLLTAKMKAMKVADMEKTEDTDNTKAKTEVK